MSAIFPDSLEEWMASSEKCRDASDLMCRMEGALVLLYAAECCGVDAVGHEAIMPLENLVAGNADFFSDEGVKWKYQLVPYFNKQYYNETIDYQATLAAADDFLSVLDEYDIPWCSWYGNYGPMMDYKDQQWKELFPGYPGGGMRAGAEYKMVSENYMIDTGLMEVYQKYMNK